MTPQGRSLELYFIDGRPDGHVLRKPGEAAP